MCVGSSNDNKAIIIGLHIKFDVLSNSLTDGARISLILFYPVSSNDSILSKDANPIEILKLHYPSFFYIYVFSWRFVCFDVIFSILI